MPQVGARRRGERGVALLLVLVGIAVLSLVANEVRYNSMVELRLATNQRDELRAHFLARSGVALSRLMLRYQKQIDMLPIPNFGAMLQQALGSNPALGGLLGGLTGGQVPAAAPGGAGAPGMPPGMPGMSTASIQLWRMAKVDCHMLEGLVPAVDAKGLAAPQVGGEQEVRLRRREPRAGQGDAGQGSSARSPAASTPSSRTKRSAST
jgi:general secretion pathway protein K